MRQMFLVCDDSFNTFFPSFPCPPFCFPRSPWSAKLCNTHESPWQTLPKTPKNPGWIMNNNAWQRPVCYCRDCYSGFFLHQARQLSSVSTKSLCWINVCEKGLGSRESHRCPMQTYYCSGHPLHSRDVRKRQSGWKWHWWMKGVSMFRTH